MGTSNWLVMNMIKRWSNNTRKNESNLSNFVLFFKNCCVNISYWLSTLASTRIKKWATRFHTNQTFLFLCVKIPYPSLHNLKFSSASVFHFTRRSISRIWQDHTNKRRTPVLRHLRYFPPCCARYAIFASALNGVLRSRAWNEGGMSYKGNKKRTVSSFFSCLSRPTTDFNVLEVFYHNLSALKRV